MRHLSTAATLALCLLSSTAFAAPAYAAKSSIARTTTMRTAEPAGEIRNQLDNIQAALDEAAHPRADKRAQREALVRGLAETDALIAVLDKYGQDSADAKVAAGQLRASFHEAITDLEGQEKLSNFEIQDLMSKFNQAEQTAAAVYKKKDDADMAIINKV